MSEFNIGDKVISKGYPYLGEEVGVIVGIDPRKNANGGKYLVEFNSLDISEGLEYGMFRNNAIYIVEPYEGCAIWLEEDLTKVEDGSEEDECKKNKSEENVKMEFERVREQKKKIVKGMSEKVLKLTLKIKEIEAEIEKIKKEWYLN